jgi:hypothetical protein
VTSLMKQSMCLDLVDRILHTILRCHVLFGCG